MILLPTLNRLDLLKRYIDSHRKTAKCKALLLVDQNDLDRHRKEYMALQDEQFEIVDTGSNISMGDKVRSVWQRVRHERWCGLLNDDHVCITKDWDKKTEELLDGKNFLSTNDGFWNFGINPVGLTAFSMPLLEVAGFPIFPPGINHWFVDDVWKHIGIATGSWLETMQINIEHRHVFNRKMEPDETYKVSQDSLKAQESMTAFNNFMQKDFPAVCERIKKFREEETQENKFV